MGSSITGKRAGNDSKGINAVDCIPKQASASNWILQLERDVADRFMDILFRCVGKFNCIIHSSPQ